MGEADPPNSLLATGDTKRSDGKFVKARNAPIFYRQLYRQLSMDHFG